MSLNDLVQLETTVVSQAGATITLADVTGLAVGDRVVIESQHGYNETGLDGNWTLSNLPLTGYYLNVTNVGKSFIGTIQSGGISGNTIILDRTVPSGAVGLPCYRENSAAVKYAIENGVSWPARKRFAIASDNTAQIRALLTDDYQEIDFNNCELFAPRGCGALGLAIAKIGGGPVSNKRYKNLTMRGNVKDSGYGFFAETGVFVQGSSLAAAFNIFGTGGAPPSGPTSNVIAENFTFIDNWRACGISLALDCFGVNMRCENTDPLRQYIQWEFQISSSQRCAFIDCVVDGDYMRGGFEPFKSIGCSFIRCGGRNTSFSSNTSGGVLFKDCYVVIDDTNPNASFSPDNFLMNINRTIEDQQGSPQAGTNGGVGVMDFSIIYNAIPYASDGVSGEIWKQVGVTPGSQGIVGAKINGVHFQVPRTNVTQNNGYTDGYVVNNNALATDTIVSRVSGSTLDSGTKLLGVTETEITQ